MPFDSSKLFHIRLIYSEIELKFFTLEQPGFENLLPWEIIPDTKLLTSRRERKGWAEGRGKREREKE